MDQQDKRVKRTSTGAKRPMRTTASRPRQRVPSSEPMSRDELRSLKNMERRKKHRRNQLIGYAIAIIAVIIAAVILSITVFFKISNISVAGDEIYANSEIISASKLKNGDNLFTFNKNDVASDIEKKLPYIESVEVKRSLTGKVVFTVTAAKASLAVDRGDSYILLSSSCKVLEDNVQVLNEDAAVIKASKLLSGAPGTVAEFENENDQHTISELAGLIAQNEIQGISEIDITDYSEIKLVYNQRIILKIGTASDFEKNIDFIKATLKKIDTDEPYFSGMIDFTIENKAFINDNITEKQTQAAEEPKTDENGEPITDKKDTQDSTKKPDNEGESTSAENKADD